MSDKNLNIALYVFAVLLGVSVFLPLTSLPIVGDVSYNRIADIESYIVVALCIAAIGLVFTNMKKFIIFPAIGVWVTLLFPAIKGMFESDDGGFLSKATDKASGVMQDFAADLFMNVTDFSWGGFVFLLALLGFTVVSVLRSIK